MWDGVQEGERDWERGGEKEREVDYYRQQETAVGRPQLVSSWHHTKWAGDLSPASISSKSRWEVWGTRGKSNQGVASGSHLALGTCSDGHRLPWDSTEMRRGPGAVWNSYLPFRGASLVLRHHLQLLGPWV